MALAMQHFDQSENMASVVAQKVEMNGFSPQDHMKVRFDIMAAQPRQLGAPHQPGQPIQPGQPAQPVNPAQPSIYSMP